jgi:hypothetical protein
MAAEFNPFNRSQRAAFFLQIATGENILLEEN